MNKQVKMKTEKAHNSLSGKKFKRIENQISMFVFGLSLLAKLIRAWFHLRVDEVLLVEKSVRNGGGGTHGSLSEGEIGTISKHTQDHNWAKNGTFCFIQNSIESLGEAGHTVLFSCPKKLLARISCWMQLVKVCSICRVLPT